jgi:hypothetical protein
MTVSELATARGMRLVLLDGGREMLKAEVSKVPSAPGATVYWRGRVQLQQMVTFFAKSCPPASAPSFGALAFQMHNRVRVDGSPDAWDLVGRLPKDVRFVRLEHTGGTGSPSPDFITWSRIDLAEIPLDEPAPDYIAVSALPGWLHEIAGHLAEFVSDTHVAQLRPSMALDRVRELLHHIPS